MLPCAFLCLFLKHPPLEAKVGWLRWPGHLHNKNNVDEPPEAQINLHSTQPCWWALVHQEMSPKWFYSLWCLSGGSSNWSVSTSEMVQIQVYQHQGWYSLTYLQDKLAPLHVFCSTLPCEPHLWTACARLPLAVWQHHWHDLAAGAACGSK